MFATGAAWKRHRGHLRIAAIGAAGLPLAFVLGVLSRLAASPPIAEAAFVGVAGVSLIVFGIGVTGANLLRCPGCKRPFFGKGATINPLARACRHCGLTKWTDPVVSTRS